MDNTDKSKKINPAMPMTNMMHLLHLKISRDQVKLGYYLGQGHFRTDYKGLATGLFGGK